MPDSPEFFDLLLSFRQPAGAEPGLAGVMLDGDEAMAVVHGLIGLIECDEDGSDVAATALEKLAAVLPPGVLVPTEEDGEADVGEREPEDLELKAVALAIEEACKLRLLYTDSDATVTERVVRPVALEEDGRRELLHAWCELRGDFRVFRVDRILDMVLTDETWPGGRARLLRQWRAAKAAERPA